VVDENKEPESRCSSQDEETGSRKPVERAAEAPVERAAEAPVERAAEAAGSNAGEQKPDYTAEGAQPKQSKPLATEKPVALARGEVRYIVSIDEATGVITKIEKLEKEGVSTELNEDEYLVAFTYAGHAAPYYAAYASAFYDPLNSPTGQAALKAAIDVWKSFVQPENNSGQEKNMSTGTDAFGGYADALGGYVDPYGGYSDPYGGYTDAFGGYADPYGGYSDASGGYFDAYGGYTAPTGEYVDPASVAAYVQGVCDTAASMYAVS